MAKKPTRKPEEKPPPKCKAILLCNQTIVEAGTGRVSIIGVFSRFTVASLPTRLKPFCAFLQLAEGIGRYEIVVEIHDLQTDQVLARGVGSGIEFPERLTRLNITIPIRSLPVSHAGVYDLVVFANGQEIDRQQFKVVRPEGAHESEEAAD